MKKSYLKKRIFLNEQFLIPSCGGGGGCCSESESIEHKKNQMIHV